MFRAIFFLFILTGYSSTIFANTCVDEVPKFKNEIKEICGEIEKSGNTELVEANGELKAGISGVVRKILGDAGADINGKVKRETYEGVLREELAKDRFDARKCGQEMFKSIMKQVCSETKTEDEHSSKPSTDMQSQCDKPIAQNTASSIRIFNINNYSDLNSFTNASKEINLLNFDNILNTCPEFKNNYPHGTGYWSDTNNIKISGITFTGTSKDIYILGKENVEGAYSIDQSPFSLVLGRTSASIQLPEGIGAVGFDLGLMKYLSYIVEGDIEIKIHFRDGTDKVDKVKASSSSSVFYGVIGTDIQSIELINLSPILPENTLKPYMILDNLRVGQAA